MMKHAALQFRAILQNSPNAAESPRAVLARRAHAGERIDTITARHASTPLDSLLSDDHFVFEPARHIPGAKLLYGDPERNRAAGFKVPANNTVSPQLRQELTTTYGIKSVRTNGWGAAPAEGEPGVLIKSDRYRDYAADGAGRAGVINGRYGKGAGLMRNAGARGYEANPGTCPLVECIIEGAVGNVTDNIYTQGGTSIDNILDLGDRYRGEA